MKTINLSAWLVISIFLFLADFAIAQNFKGFLMGGISTSQVSGDALAGFDKAGIMFGGGVVLPVSRNKKSMVGMEMYYIQKGSKMPSNLDQGDASYYVLQLNYLEVPIYFKYAATDRIQAYIGGAIGVLTKSKEESDNAIPDGYPFNKFDFSGVCGIEYLLSDQWHLKLHGIQSLASVRDLEGPSPYYFFENGQYNSVIAFTINYYFKKEKNNE